MTFGPSSSLERIGVEAFEEKDGLAAGVGVADLMKSMSPTACVGWVIVVYVPVVL